MKNKPKKRMIEDCWYCRYGHTHAHTEDEMMAAKYLNKKRASQKPEERGCDTEDKTIMTIICDLDGTLALFGDNNPYDRDYSQDLVNVPVASIVKLFKDNGVIVLMVSGRKAKYREQTEKWLEDNRLFYDELYMPRGDDDFRKDVILKREIYEAHIKGKHDVLFVLDDRNQVVQLWRELGLTCLQVAEGDF